MHTESGKNALISSHDGVGPLLCRTYRATVVGSALSAAELMRRIAGAFPELAPALLAEFSTGATRPLAPGDEMRIKLPLMAPVKVRVVHQDERALTLQTMAGHPEAGRIRFACERKGDALALSIVSRARSATWLDRAGYLLAGKLMQTRIWTEFLRRAAELAEGRLAGPVRTRTETARPGED